MQQHAKVEPNPGHLHLRYGLVQDVRWQVLSSEDAATAREADLIVALRPPFNAIGPVPWAYLVVDRSDTLVRFELRDASARGGAARTYGCFPHLGKGVGSRPGIACSDGYVAFLRLLWAASGDDGHVPARITRSAPATFETRLAGETDALLHPFLSGRDKRLLGVLADAATAREAFMQPALARDLAMAERFFRYGPEALRSLRLRHGAPARPIRRHEIERWLREEVVAAIGDFR